MTEFSLLTVGSVMTELNINRNYNIERLHKYLNYELSSSVLLILYLMSSLAIYLMALAAIIFTPLLMKSLFQERKYGWITFFVIIVVVPFILAFVLESPPEYKMWLYVIPLALFYFYCFVLRLTVDDWKESISFGRAGSEYNRGL